MRSSHVVAALGLGVLLGMSCQFKFNDELIYACATESDCAGGGYQCVSGTCCRATGEELCGDGKDNDCDGRIDGAGVKETCNGLDDDCDGEADEDFELQRDPRHCGACGTACDGVTQYCNAGTCELRPEIDCHNGVDEDEDGTLDCNDASCNLLSCGDGCVCKELKRAEVSCGDGVDSDGDGTLDCADSDCAYQACGEGCMCLGEVPRETGCSDQLDNDANGQIDCSDLTCAGQVCVEGSTQTCSGGACLCNGRALAVEEAALCGDGVDNDCDALTDCLEPGCDGLSCGSGCECVGVRKAERSCENLADDDGDGLVDCADQLDCPESATCTAVLSGSRRGGRCNPTGQCITEFCFDGADNDGDGLADCEDPDCSGASCQADGALGCGCVDGVKVESDCGDGDDNDGDGLRDCADVVDCPAGSACFKLSNGQAGVCQSANNACN